MRDIPGGVIPRGILGGILALSRDVVREVLQEISPACIPSRYPERYLGRYPTRPEPQDPLEPQYAIPYTPRLLHPRRRAMIHLIPASPKRCLRCLHQCLCVLVFSGVSKNLSQIDLFSILHRLLTKVMILDPWRRPKSRKTIILPREPHMSFLCF